MHRAAADFWQAYAALTEEIRRRADKQFALLKANPRHSSLQFKRSETGKDRKSGQPESR
jgi:hypothetical protein